MVDLDERDTPHPQTAKPSLRASYTRKKNRLLVAILMVGLSACGFGIYTFYSLAVMETRAQLSTVAKNHARLLQAATSSREGNVTNLLKRVTARVPTVHTLSGVVVKFDYGTIRDDLITVYTEGFEAEVLRYAANSPVAEPMRLALAGRSGTTVSYDHRGHRVLAAYEPIDGWGVGVVLKVQLDELEAPFVLAATVASPIIMFTILIVQILILRMTNPLIRDLEWIEDHTRFVGLSADEAILVVDEDGVIEHFGAGAERLFNQPSEQALGTHLSALIPAILPGTPAHEIARYLSSHRSTIFGTTSQGTTVELDHRTKKVGSGSFKHVSLVLKPTARIEAETPAAESARARQRLIVELAAHAIGTGDEPTTLSASARTIAGGLEAAACAVWEIDGDATGFTLRAASDSSFGRPGETHVPAGTSSQAGYAFLSRASLLVTNYSSETRFATTDVNAACGYKCGLSVLLHNEAGPSGVLSLHARNGRAFDDNDIATAEALANVLGLVQLRCESKRETMRYRSAFVSAADACVIVDALGIVIAANPPFEALTGFDADEVIGRNLKFLGHDRTQHWLDSAAARALAEGKAWQGVSINRKRNGVTIQTLRTVAPIRDNHGRAAGYVVTIHPDGRTNGSTGEQVRKRQASVSAQEIAQKTVGDTAARIKPRPPTEAVEDRRAGEGRLENDKRKVRILVAEDNPASQQIAVRQLEALGYEADLVSTGFEALEALDRVRYDVVLMDCVMPEMDGFEATAEIRRREDVARHTPVVAMTAHNLEGDRERCLESGMDDFLAKPVGINELGTVIARWLPKSMGDAEVAGPEFGRTRYSAAATAASLRALEANESAAPSNKDEESADGAASQKPSQHADRSG